MDRRATFLLTGLAVLAATFTAVSQPVALVQSDQFTGTWRLNLEKSKYDPGPPPKNGMVHVQGEGQNRKATSAGIDAAGNAFNQVYTFIFDSQPHPLIGHPRGDAAVYTPIDANTVKWSVMNGGEVVLSGTDTISPDGKAVTITTMGFAANGRPINNIAVFDKQ